MAESKNPSVTVLTEPFILSYPTLLKAEPYMENGKAKGEPVFSFEAISNIEDLGNWRILDRQTDEFTRGKVEVRLVQLAKEKWGADFDVVAAVKHGGLSWPFKKGDEKADEKGVKADHYRGKKFFRGKAFEKKPPVLRYRDETGALIRLSRSTDADRERINEMFYGGAICVAEMTAVAGTTGDNKYVTFYFNGLMFMENGDRLGNVSAIERVYGTEGGKSDIDPTEGMKKDLDDEIPF